MPIVTGMDYQNIFGGGGSDKDAPPFTLYMLSPRDVDDPETLRQLRVSMEGKWPIIVWRIAALDGMPLPTLLEGYEDLKVFDGDYQNIRDDVVDYLAGRNLITLKQEV